RSAGEQIRLSFRNGHKSYGHGEQSCIVARTGPVLLENDLRARGCTHKKVSSSCKPSLNRLKDPVCVPADADLRPSNAFLRAEILQEFFPVAVFFLAGGEPDARVKPGFLLAF